MMGVCSSTARPGKESGLGVAAIKTSSPILDSFIP
jgi:hypothetical protein